MNSHLESGKWIQVALGLPILLLALLIGWQLIGGVRLVPPRQPKIVPAPAAPLPEFVLPPVEVGYKDLLQRPPFTPTRKASSGAAGLASRTVMPRSQFVLVGVTITSDKRVALLRGMGSEKLVRVEEGKEINGVLLEKVENGKVVLMQGGDREELAVKIQPAQAQRPAGDAPQSEAHPQPGGLVSSQQPGSISPPPGGKPIPRPKGI